MSSYSQRILEIDGDTLAVIPIHYIVNANVFKVKADSIKSENVYLKKINSIMCTQIVNYQQNAIDFQSQVANLNAIRISENEINRIEVNKAISEAEKYKKRYRLTLGAGFLISFILVLL